MKRRVISLTLVCIFILASLSATFAAPFDLIHKTDPSKNYSFDDFLDLPSVFDYVYENLEDYLIEGEDGKLYDLGEVQAALEAGAEDFNDAISGLTPVEPPEEPVEPDPEIPPVPGTYKLVLSAKNLSLVGNGYSNTTIEVELVDTATEQRVNINGLDVRLTTTFGQLSDYIVTLQNGYAHTTIRSEAVQRATDVDLDAQIIESTVPVALKKNITGMSAKLPLIFTTPGGALLEDFPRLLKAESNQADRVTLYFDRYVDPAYFKSGAVAGVWQNDPKGDRDIRGFQRLAGNDPHTLEVILEKDDYLTDNKWVYVDLELTKNGHILSAGPVSFILTDNRKPQVTAIEHDGNMREITVYFSEAIYRADFNLDGGTNIINDVIYHDFDASSQTDSRHIVTLDVAWLSPGEHKLQVSAPKDFAWLTDPVENIGTTQELTFTVLPDDAKPTARVLVESPEQYRIFLDNATILDSNFSLQDVELQMETAPGVWNEVWLRVSIPPSNYPDSFVNNGYNGRLNNTILRNKKLAWVTSYGNYDELVVETNTDWTFVFDTGNTGENYYNNNFRLVIPEGMFRNKANNRPNDEIILPLNLEIDDVGPKFIDIDPIDTDLGEFELKFDEPIKGLFIEEPEVGETPSQLQDTTNNIPNIVVEYRGKNSSGVVETIYGEVTGYASVNGRDKDIYVEALDNLKDLVDYQCYDEEWELVVRNVTDDIGNAAETVKHKFTVKATAAPGRKYKITSAELLDYSDFNLDDINVNLPFGLTDADMYDYDIVRVEYSDIIRITGYDDSAVDKSNYKLNGRELGEDSFVLVDLDSRIISKYHCYCRYPYEGYNAVYIFTPWGSTINRLDPSTSGEDENASNTLEVNQRLYSKDFPWADGVKLGHPYEVELDYYSQDYIQACEWEWGVGRVRIARDGHTYTATVTGNAPAPLEPTVDYQWQVKSSLIGSWQDVGTNSDTYYDATRPRIVRVVVTGTGDFSGTRTSNTIIRL